MKDIEKIGQNNIQDDIFKMKSTVQFLLNDIDLTMQKVTFSQYEPTIPNLFEKLTEFKNELLILQQELNLLLKEINLFENKISLLNMLELAECELVFENAHQILLEQLNLLKINYQSLKHTIITFTDSFKKNKKI